MVNWRKYNGALIPQQPPHLEIEVEKQEVFREIEKEDAYFARWTTEFDCNEETNFWYVICDQPLELHDYSINTRSKITRGLKNCEVRRIDKKELIENGYDTYKQAFKRYNTFQKLNTEKQFKDNILLLESNWDLWGVYFNNQLVGYSQNRLVDQSCDYSMIKFHPDFLKYYSSYALFYSMNRYYLNELKYKYVNDGSRSISHDTDIQGFLIRKFKFRKAFCHLHLIYSRKILILLFLLYPIRNILLKFDYSFFIKINTLLRQEAIRRVYIHTWRVYNGAIIPLTPPHINIKESFKEIKLMVKNSKVYFARWTSDFDCGYETEFWYLIKDSFLGIEEYSSNTRKSIKRGLKNVDVKLISKKRLLREGYEVYNKAFERYNTHILIKSEDEFKSELIDLDDNWDFWGVFSKDGKMIGFSQNKVESGYCNFSTTKFHPDYLRLRTSDVLFYTMTDYYLNDLKLKYVTGGTRSMSHDTNIQKEYLRKFKYRKAYCKLNIIYSPTVKALLKIIFPIKGMFYIFNTKFTSKIQTLIEHEKIRRSFR